MKPLPSIATLLLALLVAVGIGCRPPAPRTARVEFGEGVTGSVTVASANVRMLGVAVQGAQTVMNAILPQLNAHNPDSEVAKLNKVAGSGRLPISRSTFRALDLARHYSLLTDGAYDISSGPLYTLWANGTPPPHALAEARSRIGMGFVEASDIGTISFTASGVELDPGPLAYAYAIDMAVVDLRRKMRGPVHLAVAGMARTDGAFPDDEAPRLEIGWTPSPLGFIRMNESGAAVIRRHPRWDANARPDSMLLDPRSGEPVRHTRIAAVTGPLTITALALAEALIIADPDEAEVLLARFPGYEAITVPDREPVVLTMTPGMRTRLSIPNPGAVTIVTLKPAEPESNDLPFPMDSLELNRTE
ncbi:MAG TPA: FAD:protein FMN transferase [Kiritimatiellia bacterium]|nr:FAD:protein FMN transferase [Kiritimatiellia bacterium]